MATIDFRGEIGRHANFFGRGDIMRELENRLLDGPCEGGWVLVSGGPGMGKSNILARFLKEYSPETPHHFLRRNYLDSNQPEVIVQSLIEQIVKKYPDRFEGEEVPREHLQTVLQRVSDKVLQPKKQTLILIVDGLDEAEGTEGTDNPLQRIFPYYLPPNVRVLCASRPLYPHLSFLRKQDRFYEIDLDSKQHSASNDEAIRAFWSYHGPNFDPPLSAGFVEDALDKSEGNLLHAVKLREWLEDLPVEERRAITIPRGLQGFIEEIWTRLERLEDETFDRLRHGLGLLCAAREALPLSALEACLGWIDPRWKHNFLRVARPFLLEIPKHWNHDSEDAYRPYHESFREFAAEQLGEAFVRECHQRLTKNWAQWPIQEGVSAFRKNYALRHGSAHAMACGEWERVRSMLTNVGYMQTKYNNTDVFALENELQRATEAAPEGEREAYQKLHRAVRDESHWLKKEGVDFCAILYNRLFFYGDSKEDILRILQIPSGWKNYVLKHPVRLGGQEIRTLSGHTNWVNNCAISSDGRVMASASDDETLKVWDMKSGREIHTLSGHTYWVNGCAISPDKRVVVSASSDHTLKVWDLQSGRETRTLHGHTHWVRSCAISPDGRVTVSASWDKTLKVWDLQSGREIRTLHGHTDWVNDCEISSDGRVLVSASSDHTLKVWDMQSGREIRTLSGHTNWVNDCAISLDGRVLVSASSDQTLKVWDLQSGREIRTLSGHTHSVNGCAISPDGRVVVSASWDHTIKVWDLQSGQEIRTLSGHTHVVNGCATSPDGRVLVSASDDNTLKVWDLQSRGEIRTLSGHTNLVNCCAVSRNGLVLVSSSSDRTLKVWDLQSGREVHTLYGHSNFVNACAISPNGRVVVSASDDHTLKVWDLQSGREIRTLSGHTNLANGCVITPDGRVAASASSDYTLKVWDIQSGREIRTLSGHTNLVNGCAISPDGRVLVSASWDTTLKVWDLQSGREIRTLYGHTDWVRGCAISPDGRVLASASSDCTLKVWDLQSGQTIRTLSEHTHWVRGCAIASNGRILVSASSDRTLKVWDLQSGQCLHTIYGCTPFRCVTVDPRNRFIYAGDEAGNVWVLEEFGEETKAIETPRGAVRVFVSYSHEDGKRLDGLRKILKILKEEGAIVPWMDKEIVAGDRWEEEIKKNLEQAQLIVMAVSLNFRASDYCSKIETPRALEKLENGSARVVPIILSECGWRNSPLKDLLALPDDGNPIKKWTDSDDAWANVEEGLRKVLGKMRERSILENRGHHSSGF